MALAELDCIMHLVAPGGLAIPVTTHATYDSQDPYGVRVTFYPGEHAPVSWVFARDLLAEGTVRPSGFGDVRIWPGRADQTGLLFLKLSSFDGQALFTVPMDLVTPWLCRSYHLVPAGLEGASLDLDGELSRLLGEVA
ncbi:hypothetical protein M2163_000733 [Streptomyces sp. SAI-135]|uniref:SsgA family sporulation/cell division regulator n=2 Tax=Streptomyces TaxID=1883 RepID=UPI00247ED0E3|nr:hypothetical protein [Streptomyces sp. SAI-090]MDH6613625.1 hypothetical protein [Streptomyces sp. SAI-135]